MPKYSASKIREYFKKGDNAHTTTDKGRALEDLICYIFEKIPGISVTKRNQLNIFNNEEIDVAFWNDINENGLPFLPNILLVECKNWSNSVGSAEIGWFIQRLRNRGRDYGFLIASNGITGNPAELTDAHMEIASALQNGIHIIVITRSEIERLNHTEELIKLIKGKLYELAVSGTVFLYDNIAL